MTATQLTVASERWPLARPFAISRGVKTEAHVVVAKLSCDGVTGKGECVPYPRYNETVDGVIAEINSLAGDLKNGLDNDGLLSLMKPGAARNAVDCALWDLAAKQSCKRVWQLLNRNAPEPSVTAETIGIDSVDNMAAQARKLSHAKLLKIKLGADDVIDRMQAVRDNAPNARLVIDPNEAWNVTELIGYVPELKTLGVEMIEQPVPANDDEGLKNFTSAIPICADEACHTSADLETLVGKYDMVNVKLDKTGGLTEALVLAERAHSLGFGIMVGCMVGTSLAMAPAMLIAGVASVIDLDGPLLLKNDRVPGLEFSNGLIHAPAADLWG